jgi:hypothetical protein
MDHKDHPDASNPWAETHHRGRARMAALGAITHEANAASTSWVRAGFEPDQWERLEDRGISCFVKLEHEGREKGASVPTFGFMRLDRVFLERLAHAMAAAPKTDGLVSLRMKPEEFQMSSGVPASQWNMTMEIERSVNAGGQVQARLHGTCKDGLLLSADIAVSNLMTLAHQLTSQAHQEPELTSGYSSVDNEMRRLTSQQTGAWEFEGVVHGLAEPSRFSSDDQEHLLIPSKCDSGDDLSLSVELNRMEAPGFAPVWRLRDDASHLQVCNGVLFWPGDDAQEDLESVFAVLSSSSPIAEREFRTGLRHRALMQMAKATSMQAEYGDVPHLLGDVITSAGRGAEPHLKAEPHGLVAENSLQPIEPTPVRRPMRMHL